MQTSLNYSLRGFNWTFKVSVVTMTDCQTHS